MAVLCAKPPSSRRSQPPRSQRPVPGIVQIQKPAAGSAAAVVAARRRASPVTPRIPAADVVASIHAAVANQVANQLAMSERMQSSAATEEKVPVAPPGHPRRPPSPAVKFAYKEAVAGAVRQPIAPPTHERRIASPRRQLTVGSDANALESSTAAQNSAAVELPTHAVKSLIEKQVALAPTVPQWDDRPVATPSHSIAPGCTKGEAAFERCEILDSAARIGEMWLRLARVVLLEDPRMPLSKRRHHGTSPKEEKSQPGDADALQKEDVPTSPWTKMAIPQDFDGGEEEHSPADAAAGGRRGRPADPGRATHELCDSESPERDRKCFSLGEFMEESVSWVDLDSEDECSPKGSVQLQQDDQEDDPGSPPHRCLKAIQMQQKAPGIVENMPKCLSF